MYAATLKRSESVTLYLPDASRVTVGLKAVLSGRAARLVIDAPPHVRILRDHLGHHDGRPTLTLQLTEALEACVHARADADQLARAALARAKVASTHRPPHETQTTTERKSR